MRYISLFSGIEAVSCAWKDIGFIPIAFAENDPFPCAVLEHHFPNVPNLGDVNCIDWIQYENKVDIVVGGSPCQDFSIAGTRAGLDGERGNLTFKFAEICNAIKPDFIVWENVPGVLSMPDNTFGHFIGRLANGAGELLPPGGRWTSAGCVFGKQRNLAWRILDAQYFGVPQRRKRVFLVGCPGNKYNSTEILFEWPCLQRSIETRKIQREKIARPIKASTGERGGDELSVFCCDNLRGYSQVEKDICPTLTSSFDKDTPFCYQTIYPTLTGSAGGISHTGNAWREHEAYILSSQQGCAVAGKDLCPTITAAAGMSGNNQPVLFKNKYLPRRIMPIETERLQGFPDNWTNVVFNGKPASDRARYKAIGNSMAVPVIKWIGERIKTYVYKQEQKANK